MSRRRLGPPERPRAKRRWSMTPREREYMVAMWDGLSNREIAHRLGVSEPTVKETIYRLCLISEGQEYTGRHNRVKLLRWAIEEGYLDVWQLRLARAKQSLKLVR